MFYIAIVGRPNVGKSTLFNRIAGGRPAIVDGTAGVTRDRNAAVGEWAGRRFGIIDTGGFEPESEDIIMSQVREQAEMAIEEADVIFFVVDGREGLTPTDDEIARKFRRAGKQVRLVINKIDDPRLYDLSHDFAALGFAQTSVVSAEHSLGVAEMLDEAVSAFPEDAPEEDIEDEERPVHVAVVGRPNVGKSSLVNRLLGYDRMMVSDIAGTTRDSIDTEVRLEDRRAILIDTAGIRKKSKVTQKLEKYSVIMAMKSIERADVALLLIDANDGPGAQESKIAGLVEDARIGCVIVVNKWDLIEKDEKTILRYEENIRRSLPFLSHAPVVFISSLTGQRVTRVWDAVDGVYGQYRKRIGSGALNAIMERIVKRNPPPLYRTRRVKIYYATQASVAPPAFVFMSNYPEGIKEGYRRYIMNKLREEAGFGQAPMRLIFRKPAGRRRTARRR